MAKILVRAIDNSPKVSLPNQARAVKSGDVIGVFPDNHIPGALEVWPNFLWFTNLTHDSAILQALLDPHFQNAADQNTPWNENKVIIDRRFRFVRLTSIPGNIKNNFVNGQVAIVQVGVDMQTQAFENTVRNRTNGNAPDFPEPGEGQN